MDKLQARSSTKEINNEVKEAKDNQIEVLAGLLLKKEKQNQHDKAYASAKTVLALLGAGATIAGAFIAPKAGAMVKTFSNQDNEWKDWRKFNSGYLAQTLRRLRQQKLIEIKEIAGEERIMIAENGKTKIFQYSLDDLEIPRQKNWDKKWRIIIYDVPIGRRQIQNSMRKMLKKLGFLQMQESVYITPYPCFKEVEFLRQHYYLWDYIQYLLVEKIENDSAYKKYFGLK